MAIAMKWNGSLEEMPERLQVVILELAADGYLKHQDTVQTFSASIQEVVTELWSAFSDGFDLSDLKVLGEALAVLTKIAVDTVAFSDQEIDECVADFALTIYKIWDPEIPYLWESAENKLESAAIRGAANLAVGGFRRLIKDLDKAPDETGVLPAAEATPE